MITIPNSQLIKIAVTGHANSGKTTMIQTLMKQTVGEIGDWAGATPDVLHSPYEYEGLQAVFIDTPGFEEANTLLLAKKGYTGIDTQLEKDLEYDIKAFHAIESSDIVLYIASLESVPDRSDKKEIELVVSAGKPVVAILNKKISRLRLNNESNKMQGVQGRIQQWKKVLLNEGVSQVLVFDAHWYDPATVIDIYNEINKVLSNNKSVIFQKSLLAFQKHQDNKFKDVCALIFKCLDKCRQPIKIYTAKFDYDTKKTMEEAILETSTSIYDIIMDFSNTSSSLYYEIAAPLNIDQKFIKQFELNTTLKINIRAFLMETGATASGLAALGTTLGAAVGAAASAILTGGVGTISGGAIGAQVGSAIGTCVGGIWSVIDKKEQSVSVVLPNEVLNIIECICLTKIWALAQHGFGVGKEVDEAIMTRRHAIVKEMCGNSAFDLQSADERQIIERCIENLHELNKIALARVAHGK